MIEIKNLHKSYRRGKEIIPNLNLTLGETGFGDLISPAFYLTGSYKFNTILGVRAGVGGITGKGYSSFASKGYEFNFIQGNVDAMLDVSSLIWGFNHKRLTNLYAFAGAGLFYGFDNDEAASIKNNGDDLRYLWTDSKAFVAGRLGIGSDFRCSERFSISIEANANILSDHFNSKKAGNLDWHFALLAGINYKINKNTRPSIAYAEKVRKEQMAKEAAAAAAKSAGELDFVVLLGDLVSMVETEKDAQLANELAHKITSGQVPVIYARGNHEIKGEYAEDLHKYVGARGQDYYYTATLGQDVFVVVLDMGEDHEDDWWEYYGTAQFDLYRQEQTEFLEELVKKGEYQDYRYRLALCHIPIQHVDNKFESFKVNWTRLLNEMDIDMCLSGHKHELWPFIPGQVEGGTALNSKGYYLTDFNFPGFLVGRRSLVQEGGTQSNGNDHYTGLCVHADFAAGTQTAYYHNSQLQILDGAFPFAEGTFRKIQLELKRPKK